MSILYVTFLSCVNRIAREIRSCYTTTRKQYESEESLWHEHSKN